MVSSISSSYTSSVDQLISQSIAYERRPTDELIKKKSNLSSKSSVYTEFKSTLRTFKDKIHDYYAVGSLNTIATKKAYSSDESKFTVDALADANVGKYTLKINRLAKRDTGYSKQITSADTNLAGLGNTSFTIQVGDSEVKTVNIEVDGAETNKEVLQKIADAINETGLKVSASVIDDTSTTSRLSIISDEEGSDNAITLANNGTPRIMKKLGFIDRNDNRLTTSGTAGGFVVSDVEELNAEIEMNGLLITKQSNEINDVLDGVTLNLLSTQEASDSELTFTIENDKENVKSEIDSFIEEYNKIVNFIREKTKVDGTTYTRGDLYGDSSLSRLRFELSNILFTQLDSAGEGDPKTLADIGIKIQRDGELSISDSSKFNEMMEDNIDGVVNLFKDENGLSKQLDDLLNEYTRTGGTIDSKTKAIRNQVQNLEQKISDNEKRLLVREDALRREYTQLQKMMSKLNSQQSMIENSMSSISSYFN